MLVMFDLPVGSKRAKTDYRRFRDFLQDDGFAMLQYSVYGRHCATRESADAHAARVRFALPPAGEVRILRVTEAQYARMEVFRNFERRHPEPAPAVLELW
ncbi:MAG: CRISPR-associated endonuclease Cas2 [Acidimicrobiia bacterium]